MKMLKKDLLRAFGYNRWLSLDEVDLPPAFVTLHFVCMEFYEKSNFKEEALNHR